MNPFAAIAVKTVGAAGAAALLSMGAASAFASTAPPSPAPATNTNQPASAHHAGVWAVRRAEIAAEADVLGMKPRELVKDLRAGQKVSDLAKAKGMTEQQFETKLIANLKPRLEALVDRKLITQARADAVLDHIAKGHIPFWDGLHRPRK